MANTSHFSQAEFESIAKNFLNELDYQAKNYSYSPSNNEVKVVTTKPVEKFRQMFVRAMVKAGIPQLEAEHFMKTYKFSNSDLDGFHTFVTEILYQYGKTGRWLNLFDKEDIKAKIQFSKKEGERVPRKGAPQKGQGAQIIEGEFVKTQDHFVLKQSSACPEWLRKIENTKGDILSQVELVYE